MKRLPMTSNIVISEKDSDTIITLPVLKTNISYLLLLSLIPLLFLAYFSIITLWHQKDISNAEFFWLFLFLFSPLLYFWELYNFFRKKIAEKIVLGKEELIIDTGLTSPIYDFRKKDHLTRYNYRKRRKKFVNLVELKSLVLTKTEDESLYLLTFKDTPKPFYIGYNLNNEEVQWLYEYILDFYDLKDFYQVIAMDETKPKKRLTRIFIWVILSYGLFALVFSISRSINA